MKVNRRQITITLPIDILEELTVSINDTDRSASDIVEDALRTHLQMLGRR